MHITDTLSRMATLIDEIPNVYVPQDDLETDISSLAMKTVLAASITLIVLTVIALLFSNKFPILKMPLFVLMAIAMAGSTLTLISSTVYLNVKSESGGPIHWHADFEVWACGNQLELRDPTGFLSNKIGTATLHEHDDQRIHLEGVAVEEKVDASLGKFMHVTGGAITDEAMVVPLNADDQSDDNIFEDEVDGDGPSNTNAEQIDPYIIDDDELGKVAYFKDGDACGSTASEVQTFVYRYNKDDKTYEQTKIEKPQDFVIFQNPNVPPGDCIIFEFGPTREKTDKLCEQYGVRDTNRCEQFGVEPDQREICESEQVNYEETQSEIFYINDEREIDALLEDPLRTDPCAPFFDSSGNRIQVEVQALDESGNPINPDTDCEAYIQKLKGTEATNGGVN